MTVFLSLPSEVLRLIFQNCHALSQLSNLGLTCKHLHALYSDNIHSTWSQVGKRSILAFEDAVITSRANRIALDHFDKGQLPPAPFPLDQLPTSAQPLRAEDIKSVMDWRHLATCIEIICLNTTNWGREVTSSIKPRNKFVASFAGWNTWRERLHRSIYRMFLLGPVLCRVYQEPLVPAINQPKNFLVQFAERKEEGPPPVLSRTEMDYLLTFPVFNMEGFETHEPVYGALADFFM
ncbi:hypothetical protein BJX66DRAFT_344425 [Aspergillus keveii]|uniref:F-box domain-containing protein n=1 Tax=Aspergillus keveii TaxID=714993 RepID=A0ABR4FLC0_9EURO